MKEPCVVCEIDVCSREGLPNEKIRKVLLALGKMYKLYYIESAEKLDWAKTVNWLSKYDFPYGPVLTKETDKVVEDLYKEFIDPEHEVLAIFSQTVEVKV